VANSFYFNIDSFVSSFNAAWNDVTAINTFGFTGKVKLSRQAFVLVNTFSKSTSFFLNGYDDSKLFFNSL